MTDRLETFVAISEVLTGFTATALWATGEAATYLEEVDAVVSQTVVDDLLSRCGAATRDTNHSNEIVAQLLGDPKFGPICRNLIVLWYCGSWTPLPPIWRAAFGTPSRDTARVISSGAYQAGLQWVAAGAHPVGARHQGFGAWAAPPKGAS
jgi:hypothetical protein